MCKCFLYKSKMFFSLNQGFLSTLLAGPLEEYILWKKQNKTEKSVAYKEKLLCPHLLVHWPRTTDPVTENCTPFIDIWGGEAEINVL